MGFKDNLKSIRKNKKLTQKELADKIGKKPLTISRYENGEIYPPFEVIEKIANVLDVPTEKLIFSETEKKIDLNFVKLFSGKAMPEFSIDEKKIKELKYIEKLFSKTEKDLKILLEIQNLKDELKDTIIKINTVLGVNEEENVINDRVKKIIEYFVFLFVIDNRINLKDFDKFI